MGRAMPVGACELIKAKKVVAGVNSCMHRRAYAPGIVFPTVIIYCQQLGSAGDVLSRLYAQLRCLGLCVTRPKCGQLLCTRRHPPSTDGRGIVRHRRYQHALVADLG